MAAGALAAYQLRGGVLMLSDAASYRSAAEAVADGHLFTTTLLPTFSAYSALDLLEAGGRLPFVDFAVGHPTVAGIVGVVVGFPAALGVVVAVAAVALAVVVVLGNGGPPSAGAAWLRAVAGVGVVAAPTFRYTVQGGLSEPLFAAVVVGLAAAVLRHRRTGRGFGWVFALAAAAGLVRFVGAPLAVVPAVEHLRRHGRVRRALAIGAMCAIPALVDVVLAGAAGGGHTARWHGIDGSDVRLAARSVAGWFDADTGDLVRTVLVEGDRVPWWGWPVAAAWAAAVVAALVAQLPGRWGARLRQRLPEPLAVCLALAGLVTASVFVGIASFDALAVPNNRLLLPAGVLTVCGIAWSIRLRAARPSAAAAAVAAAVAWAVVATGPGDYGRRFAPDEAYRVGEEIAATGAAAVVSNDADRVFWHTGLPAAYLPPDRVSVTGEDVDRSAAFDALPCALHRYRAVLVLVDGVVFGAPRAPELERLTVSGRFVASGVDGATIYRPGPTACGP